MRRPGHPSMRKLHRWLEGEEATLEKHLATCNYCAGRLEPLLDEAETSIRPALLELLSIPDELPERLQVGIDQRLANRSDLTLVSEFFGLPLRTVRLMSSTPEGDT